MTQEQYNAIAKWQKETFGQATSLSKLSHLSEELKELTDDLKNNAPDRRLEFADCFFLLFGAAAADGMSYSDIVNCIEEKFAINKARKWGTPDEKGVVKHVEEPPAPVAAEGVEEAKLIDEFLNEVYRLLNHKYDSSDKNAQVRQYAKVDRLYQKVKRIPGSRWRGEKEKNEYVIEVSEKNKYYPGECETCGWIGSSELLLGGCAIADTGDYTDSLCPICLSAKVDETDAGHDVESLVQKLEKAGTAIKRWRELAEKYEDKYYETLIEGKPIHPPTRCARWVDGTPSDDNLYPIKYGSKLQFMATGFYANNRWHINGDMLVLEKDARVLYLSESPCTCCAKPGDESTCRGEHASGAWTKEALKGMLEDVVTALDLSDSALEKHGPLGTPPSELVREVMREKDLIIRALKSGMKDAGSSATPPTCCARWVSASELPRVTDDNYVLRLDKETLRIGYFFYDENKEKKCRVLTNGAAPEWDIPESKFDGVEYLDESPCTCQPAIELLKELVATTEEVGDDIASLIYRAKRILK